MLSCINCKIGSKISSSLVSNSALRQWGHDVASFASLHVLHPRICLQHNANITGETLVLRQIRHRRQSCNGVSKRTDQKACSKFLVRGSIIFCCNEFSKLVSSSEIDAINSVCCWPFISPLVLVAADDEVDCISKQLFLTANIFLEFDFQNKKSKIKNVASLRIPYR